MDASSTLPRAWVERIFLRMQGVYGTQFTAKYMNGQVVNGLDVGWENAMHVWGEELRGFADIPEAIGYGLQNLDPRFPPNAREFAQVCRMAPRKQAPALEAPAPNAEATREAAHKAKEAVQGKKDYHDWAKRPRSQYALNLLMRWASEGDRDAGEYLANLRASGKVDGATLTQRWDGRSWLPV